MSFIKNVIELISSPNHSRTTGFLIILLILAVVPLTVIVAQKQQELRQRAAEDFCTNVTQLCGSGVTIGSTCDNSGEKCKLGNQIYECK